MEKVYTPEEIAGHLQVQERTVYTWLRSGRLKGAKLGRLWRIRASDYEAFLESSTINSRRNDDEETDDDAGTARSAGGSRRTGTTKPNRSTKHQPRKDNGKEPR